MNISSVAKKITGNSGAKKLENRFIDSNGWLHCGVVEHAPRKDSPKKIIDSFEILVKEEELASHGADEVVNNIHAHNVAGMKEFLKSAQDLPQRHLSLAHDIADLSRIKPMVNTEIFPVTELNTIRKVGDSAQPVSLLEYIFKTLPKLSKENPGLLDLTEKVLSHSDVANAKFFVRKLFGSLHNMSKDANTYKEAEKFVPGFAKDILEGMPSMHLGENCKENIFFKLITGICNPKSKPENLKMLREACDMSDRYKTQAGIDVTEIANGETKVIKRNLEALPYLLENADALGIKETNVSKFLTTKAD